MSGVSQIFAAGREVESYVARVEEENAVLKAENAAVKAENAALKAALITLPFAQRRVVRRMACKAAIKIQAQCRRYLIQCTFAKIKAAIKVQAQCRRYLKRSLDELVSAPPTRTWKVNHKPEWQGEEDILCSRREIWVCARKGDDPPIHRMGTLKDAEIKRLHQIDEGHRIRMLPKTMIGKRGGILKEAASNGHIREATVISCEQGSYHEYPGEKGWYNIKVEWDEQTWEIPPCRGRNDPITAHGRGMAVMEVTGVDI